MYQAFLLKYAEIGIKGKNRYKFENALVEQIKHRLSKIEGEFEVTREQGRIFVEAKSEFDFDDAIEAMSRVFGVSSISPVEVIEDKEWNNLAQKVGDFVERQYPEQNFTFKVKSINCENENGNNSNEKNQSKKTSKKFIKNYIKLTFTCKKYKL